MPWTNTLSVFLLSFKRSFEDWAIATDDAISETIRATLLTVDFMLSPLDYDLPLKWQGHSGISRWRLPSSAMVAGTESAANVTVGK
jgi:hypothetical protein